MITQIDINELKKLSETIYNISKTLIAFYDENMNLLCSYPKMCDFCKEIRKNKAVNERCVSNDKRGFLVCKETMKPYTYTCPCFGGAFAVIYDFVQSAEVCGKQEKITTENAEHSYTYR